MLTPHLHIIILSRKINSFHFFGVTGFAAGTILGGFLCYALHLQVAIILLMSLVGATVFLVLALIPKVVTGKETIVYYHHEIAILIACSATLRAIHQPVLPYLDIVLAGVGTFLAFGRIGCFSVGCCHGRPAEKGIKYGQEHVKRGFAFQYKNVTLFPVQLIESTFVFLIIFSGIVILFHYPPGTFLVLYTVVYGAFRFGIEFFRGDAERPYWNGLSEAQWTTLALVLVTFVLALSGNLPFYMWHTFILAGLVITSFYIIASKKRSFNFFSAKHIIQIAKALYLQIDENMNAQSSIKEQSFIIYQTDQGLKLSSGRILDEKNIFNHYTVSLINKNTLSSQMVKKLASLIKILRRHKSTYHVSEGKKGVFQIIFEEPVSGYEKR